MGPIQQPLSDIARAGDQHYVPENDHRDDGIIFFDATVAPDDLQGYSAARAHMSSCPQIEYWRLENGFNRTNRFDRISTRQVYFPAIQKLLPISVFEDAFRGTIVAVDTASGVSRCNQLPHGAKSSRHDSSDTKYFYSAVSWSTEDIWAGFSTSECNGPSESSSRKSSYSWKNTASTADSELEATSALSPRESGTAIGEFRWRDSHCASSSSGSVGDGDLTGYFDAVDTEDEELKAAFSLPVDLSPGFGELPSRERGGVFGSTTADASMGGDWGGMPPSQLDEWGGISAGHPVKEISPPPRSGICSSGDGHVGFDNGSSHETSTIAITVTAGAVEEMEGDGLSCIGDEKLEFFEDTYCAYQGRCGNEAYSMSSAGFPNSGKPSTTLMRNSSVIDNMLQTASGDVTKVEIPVWSAYNSSISGFLDANDNHPDTDNDRCSSNAVCPSEHDTEHGSEAVFVSADNDFLNIRSKVEAAAFRVPCGLRPQDSSAKRSSSPLGDIGDGGVGNDCNSDGFNKARKKVLERDGMAILADACSFLLDRDSTMMRFGVVRGMGWGGGVRDVEILNEELREKVTRYTAGNGLVVKLLHAVSGYLWVGSLVGYSKYVLQCTQRIFITNGYVPRFTHIFLFLVTLSRRR